MSVMNSDTKIFIAGATGAVGIVLCRLIAEKGYTVFGMTRKKEKAALLSSLNIKPVVLNVYEQDKVEKQITDIKPDIIMHQLTDLPFGLPAEKMQQGLIDNQKIRDIGTANLVRAAKKTAVKRFIAQSIAFMYSKGEKPYKENHMLASTALASFEKQVLNDAFSGIILRYGRFYGPRTGFDNPPEGCRIHIEAAAYAALLAIDNGSAGIYNIAEDDGEVDIRKAAKELKWDPLFRLNHLDKTDEKNKK